MSLKKAVELVQIPVIQHDLERIGKMVDTRLSELNLDGLVATEETIKSMKTLRADLNKELKDFEEQRKVVKELVNKPYQEMEDVYKQQVSDKYKNAVDVLKKKIDEHEFKIKLEKKQQLFDYFKDVTDLAGIDFVAFEEVGIDVNLSTTIKKYKEQIDEFIEKVNSDVSLINTQEHKAEIFVEYKKNLNVSKAIQDVTERKQLEQAEQERLRLIEIDRRHNALKFLSFDGFTQSYIHPLYKDLIITIEEVENMKRPEFEAKVALMKQAIKNRTEITAPVVETQITETPAAETPISQNVPKILTARFEVKGTIEQLTKLNSLMKELKIEYKNI